MKVLAFLQNQYFTNPERVRGIFAKHPDMRNNLIARYLFRGCLTGKRLRAAFGDKACNEIVWEEASPNIGGVSGSRYPADVEHMKAAIAEHAPDVILCFGKIASDGLSKANATMPILYAPHPASRFEPMLALKQVAVELEWMRLAAAP